MGHQTIYRGVRVEPTKRLRTERLLRKASAASLRRTSAVSSTVRPIIAKILCGNWASSGSLVGRPHHQHVAHPIIQIMSTSTLRAHR
jgi:hypothetical protein